MMLELSSDAVQELQQLAAKSRRSAQELANEAVEGYLFHQKHVVAAVEDGRAAAERGDMLDHEDVMAMMDEIIRNG